MKKISKILSLVLVLCLVLMPTVALADGNSGSGASNSKLPIADVKPDIPTALSEHDDIASTAIGAVQWGGYIIAIVMTAWLGIQWMLAQPAKKAELKGKMWSMAIGIVLLVASVTIVGWIWKIGQGL